MKELLNLARSSIKSYFLNKNFSTIKFPTKKGVFVTVYDEYHSLRGCIGFTQSEHLGKAVVEAARLAVQDSRFPNLKRSEKFQIEISILTKPSLIKVKSPEEYPKKIKIGEDGLMLNFGSYSGLLLPQVAIEYKMSRLKFLEEVCLKANLPKDFWKNPLCKIYKFQANIIKEKEAL